MNSSSIVNTLNGLIETCKDGEYGFRNSAEHARSAQLQQVFWTLASDYRQAVMDLQSLVIQHGGTAEDSGSTGGALHRGWIAVKNALTGHTDLSILDECERGEDITLESYRKALKKDLPIAERSIVEEQYENVKHHHTQVRNLRDDARVAATV